MQFRKRVKCYHGFLLFVLLLIFFLITDEYIYTVIQNHSSLPALLKVLILNSETC